MLTVGRSLAVRRARRAGTERGISLVLSGLIMVALLGVSSLVVDLGAWQARAANIQAATDAASLGGVVRLPEGVAAAEARAREIATANGFTDGVDDISVNVSFPTAENMVVEIVDGSVDQYFSSVFRDSQTLTRRSTSEFIQPVTLGSPRNYLGTGDLGNSAPFSLTGDGVENFWLSMSGPCTRREYGDRIAVLRHNLPNSNDYICGVDGVANPEYDPDGYLFGLTVPVAAPAATLEIYDMPQCGGSSDAGDENLDPFDVRFRVYKADDLVPTNGTVIYDSGVITGLSGNPNVSPCASPGAPGGTCPDVTVLRDCWFPIPTSEPLAPGTYYIQTFGIAGAGIIDSRHNNFSLRARQGPVFVPCTSDATAGPLASPLYSATCPQVFGLEHLPVFANVSAADPTFFLASVGAEHNGKTMRVELYDAAEGGSFIELLDPSGTAVSYDWEVVCSDGSSGEGSPCPGEQDPFGGRSGGPTTALDVSGNYSANKTFPNNRQSGRYSDRIIRLEYDLPDDIDTAYGGRTWWKLNYAGSFSGDRTTWSVQILGDPVRLIPNS